MFLFTKEMAKTLKEIRIKANLSQTEVGIRIGLKSKNAPKYISNLEAGKITNPTLRTILNYIRACGASWVEFFKELDRIDFRLRHEKMIAQVHPPPTERKIQRDAMRYEINIEFPSKEKEEIDFERLKKIIKDKVTALVNKEDNTLTSILSHQGRGEKAVMTAYQKFALEYFDFLATLNKPGMKMVTDKYQRTELKLNLLVKIKKIINSVLRGEIKRIESKKPLPSEKQEKMAIGFTKYRIRIEKLEAEVHKLLCESSVPTPWFASYKAFARESYRALKKYYGKNQELLNKRVTEIIERWEKEGLKENVLLKLKDKIIAVFGMMRLRGEI
jgi:transcriptional regulator with XRE-family HTH domain